LFSYKVVVIHFDTYKNVIQSGLSIKGSVGIIKYLQGRQAVNHENLIAGLYSLFAQNQGNHLMQLS